MILRMTNKYTCWVKYALLACVFMFAMHAQAAECHKTGTVCADGPATRAVNNAEVYRDCWRYQDTYECVTPDYVDYCAGIQQTAGCTQNGSVCSSKAPDGTCLVYTNTYSCSSTVAPSQSVVELNASYTIRTDTIDRAECASYDSNASCKLAQQTCTEPGGTRNINGQDVYKDCWKWEYSYTCVAQDYHDYCVPLRQTAGCSEVSNTCTSTLTTNTCAEYERTFRCDGRQGDPLPANITYLNTQYTISQDKLNTSQCDPSKNNPNCSLAAHTCTQPAATRNINGLDVYKDCWEWSDEYTCASDVLQNDCANLRSNPGCTEKSATCEENLLDGQCAYREHVFQCIIKDGTSKDVTTCGNGICVYGVCTGTNTTPDSDFGKVIANMEAQREMGTYFDPDKGQLFIGEAAFCSKPANLTNCCKATGGGATASNSFLLQGTKMIGNEAIRFMGSSYMYDTLSNMGVSTELLSHLYSEAAISGAAEFNLFEGANFYGISYAPAATPPFAFDPYSFAIAIAIQIATKYLSCTQEEQLLGMRKNQRLCTYVGGWSSGIFSTPHEGYCCYNSRLSRIINEQGRLQLGKSYGAAQNPDCSGFTLSEIDKLDFGKIDLSEFIDEISPNDLKTNLAVDRAQDAVQKTFTTPSNYFNSTP